MKYQGTIIRPPSEADSIILQVTTGCSHNSCTFCGAYLDKSFTIKPDHLITADLRFAAQHCRRLHTVFLADGDGLAIPQARLCSLLKQIRSALPWVKRINSYASCQNLLRRSEEDLCQLKALGLKRLYLGLESGHDQILAQVRKGVTSGDMVHAAQMVRRAGLFLSVTALLGLGGVAQSMVHAQATAKTLNRMQPHQVALLCLMLVPGTGLARQAAEGHFTLPNALQLCQELKVLLEHLELDKAQFHANHASNYLPLTGRLPRDKARLLVAIDQALAGQRFLKPDALRTL